MDPVLKFMNRCSAIFTEKLCILTLRYTEIKEDDHFMQQYKHQPKHAKVTISKNDDDVDVNV